MKQLLNILQTKYPAIVWTIIIFILCTIPSQHIPTTQNLSDKANHFIAFAGFTFFWLFPYPKPLKIISIAIIYGIGVEFWQAILPESFHRGFEWYDALADGLGSIIGYFLYVIFKRIIKRLNF
ncbi:VanZ family protein [Arcicella sp. LKC2W]|uniref:VanZ family protein n=1 Tax=Arcicella sp. LKC2W TaxID=2984198 RepID=UPI002B1EE6DE|nr:VanZ family protein [Arcicella sp. LKC2W]MEA5458116.1 VanZ family protein [Arcicella sp. LKC2W]